MIRVLLLLLMSVSISYTQTMLDTNQNVNVRLFFVKQNYEGNEPIEVEFSIENLTSVEQEFILSDLLCNSLTIKLRTSKNEIIPMNSIIQAKIDNAFVNPSLYRTIILLPRESFSRLFDLREFYDIDTYDSFYTRGQFYPDPDNRSFFIESDYTPFTHMPPIIVQKQIEDNQRIRVQEIEVISTLLPTEMIISFFEAQFMKDWDKFLLHIDPNRLIFSFRNFGEQYKATTDGEFKLELLEQFQRFFTIQWNIPLISYKIINTTIQEDTAIVTVDAMESIRATSRRIRYNFILYRSSRGQWLISDYTVLILN